MQKHLLFLTAILLSVSSLCFASEETKPTGTLINLSVEASRPAPNDMARATAYAEETGRNPAELSRRVNSTIAAALETAKKYPEVKTRSGSTRTHPTYEKNGRISGWRMRSELMLESQNMTALSELLGKLQMSLAVSQLVLVPAPETRSRVEDEAMLEAIAAFQKKAGLIADALKKTHRIRQMSIQSEGRPPLVPVMRASRMTAAEATPAPIEAGESTVSVTVSGQIELPIGNPTTK